MSFTVALISSLAIALVAFAARTLSLSGAVAAGLVGTVVLWQTALPGATILGAFFLSSTLISRATRRSQDHSLGAKGDRRDAWQVLANGGAAAVGALFDRWQLGSGLWLVSITLAAAAGDTWATAIGALSRTAPVDIVRWRPVMKGTSGGVSVLGTIGGLAGAGLIGLVAWFVTADRRLGLAAVGIGFAGMIFDSILGATVQGKFRCGVCDRATERRRHHCGTMTHRVGGIAWFGNDHINATATAAALLVGLWLWHWR